MKRDKYHTKQKHAWLRPRRHHQLIHGNGILSIDSHAQRSRLKGVNPLLKAGFAVSMLFLCIVADSPALSITITTTMIFINVCWGGESLHYMRSLMRLPVLFITISCAAIAMNVTAAPLDAWNFPLFGLYLSVTPASLTQAGKLFLKAYGAITCLYFLCLSTPMHEIIAVLKRLHIPAIVIELMYLIYRYIFVLLEVQHSMTTAAKSRLGFAGYRASWYTFTHVSGNLLAASFRRSGACFDAMESRCYDGDLGFLTREAPVRSVHVLFFGAVFCTLLGLAFLLKGKGWDLF